MRLLPREAARTAFAVVAQDQTVEIDGGGRLIPPAARAWAAMRRAAQRDGIELRAGSSWRARPWATRADYERAMIARYGSVAEGQKWIAWDSMHHRGIAVDLVGGGMAADSKSAGYQRTTPTYKWMVRNAGNYGFGAYGPEPWHWEWRPVRWRRYLLGAGVVAGVVAGVAWALS